jgi:hypothetical protein
LLKIIPYRHRVQVKEQKFLFLASYPALKRDVSEKGYKSWVFEGKDKAVDPKGMAQDR